MGPKTKIHAVIAALFVAVHVVLYLQFHDRTLEDADRYVQAGRLLMETGRLDEHFHVLYAVPIACLAVFTKLFGDPRLPFVLFQSLLSALALWWLYRVMCRVYSPMAAVVAVVLYIMWWDNIRWDVVTMTESLCASVTLATLCVLAESKPGRRQVACLVALVVVAVFTRPTGLLLVMVLLAFAIHSGSDMLRRRTAVLSIGLLTIAALSIWAMFKLSESWDFTDQYFRGNIITYADTYMGRSNWIQSDPEYADQGAGNSSPIFKALRFVWHRPLHVLFVSGMKIFYLVTGVRPYYSRLHNVLTLVWMVFVYAGMTRGWKVMAPLPFRSALAVLIAGNCLLVAMTTVDWDNRFYIPMEAAVVIISAVGWAEILKPLLSRLPGDILIKHG